MQTIHDKSQLIFSIHDKESLLLYVIDFLTFRDCFLQVPVSSEESHKINLIVEELYLCRPI